MLEQYLDHARQRIRHSMHSDQAGNEVYLHYFQDLQKSHRLIPPNENRRDASTPPRISTGRSLWLTCSIRMALWACLYLSLSGELLSTRFRGPRCVVPILVPLMLALRSCLGTCDIPSGIDSDCSGSLAAFLDGVLVDCDFDGLLCWISATITPMIQQLTHKKIRLASHSPGTKVLLPRNSSWYPC